MVSKSLKLIISLLALLSPLIVASERTFGSNPATAQVVPSVTLSISPSLPAAGAAVTFRAQISFRYPNLKYRFAFGDGAQTDWQDGSQTTHSYRAPGRYLAYVDIGAPENGLVKQLAGTIRQPIQVSAAALGPVELSASPARVGAASRSVRVSQPARVAVTLSVSPTSIQTESPVTFTATVDGEASRLRYRFFYGDGSSPSAWQNDNQTIHKYSVAGSYPAYVEVARTNRGRLLGVARSGTTQIDVNSSLAVTPSPSPDKTGVAATETATPGSLNPSGETVPAANTSPVSSAASSIFNSLRRDWWMYLLALLTILIGYLLAKFLLTSEPSFRAFPDPGSAEVRGGTQGLAIDGEVILRPNIAEGKYLVFTDGSPVVKNLRREDA